MYLYIDTVIVNRASAAMGSGCMGRIGMCGLESGLKKKYFEMLFTQGAFFKNHLYPY